MDFQQFLTQAEGTETINYFAMESSFKPNEEVTIRINKAATTESTLGFYQLELDVSKIDANGGEIPAGKLWVGMPMPVAGSETEAALSPEFDDSAVEAHVKARQFRRMGAQNLQGFLGAIAPEVFRPYTIQPVAGKKQPVDGNGNIVSKEARKELDIQSSRAVDNFSRASVIGAANKLLEGKAVKYTAIPGKKDPTKTNNKFDVAA